MATRRTTGIELRPDSCVLVAAARRGDVVEVASVHDVPAADWPAHDAAITAVLRDARRQRGLPRRAAVVAWGLPDTAGAADPGTRAALRPLTDAGFRLARVLTPPAALALVAAGRPSASPDAAVAWLLINRHGVAIAIVRGPDLLYARTFDWHYDEHASSSKAQLLRRYTLVSHLAPEVQQGIASVRSNHGIPVEALVTCGDLPELRSLTMPLIEELGIEVETLDSTDGLRAIGSLTEIELAERVPAIRIALTVATVAEPAAGRSAALLKAVAGLAGVALVGWALYAYQPWRRGTRSSGTVADAPVAAPAALPTPGAAGVSTTGRIDAPPTPPESPQRPGISPTEPLAVPAPPAQPRDVSPLPQPAVSPATSPTPAASASPGRVAPGAQVAQDLGRAPSRPIQPPALQAPLPRIDSILIDHTRRLAVIDGAIVRVGDAVGPRVVVEIQQSAVVLREPSGRLVTVRLGPG